MAVASMRIAKVRGAAVLPDNGIVNRLAGGAVPDDGGFALIGDADAGDILCREAGLRRDRAHRGDHGLPYLLRVMLDPTRRGEYLAQFLLRGGQRIEGCIERDRACRRRALVNGDKCGRRVQASCPP
jgi:hypothetical protein